MIACYVQAALDAPLTDRPSLFEAEARFVAFCDQHGFMLTTAEPALGQARSERELQL